jgi:predicted RecB family nuclease
VAALENVVNGTATPRLLLNRHCNKCEFGSECRAKAIENDDLSLIQTLQPKDIAKLNKKGIFTITQYAFTFRPRRKRRKLSLPTKHDAALKALSIQSNESTSTAFRRVKNDQCKCFSMLRVCPTRMFTT